jgi:hypothetical protein
MIMTKFNEWTDENTDGQFSNDALTVINSVGDRIARQFPGVEGSNINDALNNSYYSGITENLLHELTYNRIAAPCPRKAVFSIHLLRGGFFDDVCNDPEVLKARMGLASAEADLIIEGEIAATDYVVTAETVEDFKSSGWKITGRGYGATKMSRDDGSDVYIAEISADQNIVYPDPV